MSAKKNSPHRKNRTHDKVTPFPIATVHEIMEHKMAPNTVVSPEAAIYVTGVLEYLAAEMMELTVNAARTRKSQEGRATGPLRLEEADFDAVISSDKELKALLESTKN